MAKKVFIQTFGCQMNEADSEEMLAAFNLRGIESTPDIDAADIVLINTCTVREHAEHRAVSFLGRMAKWKRSKKGRKIIFAGCAAQRLGSKIKKDFPFLDIVFGAKEIAKFSETLDAHKISGPGGAGASSSGLSAYVTIMRGCDFKCSYCIVPSVRGPVACLPPEEILEQCSARVAAGAKEITLLGQTVNAYKYKDTDFADLLDMVSKTEGVERVRFMSPHPAFVTDKLLELFKNNDKIAKHMHLPVQSGSSAVLKSMRRGYDRASLEEKIKKIKDAGVELSTDIIVGYPTETEKDFEDTLSLARAAGFTFAYCFKFSPRGGTDAALMAQSADVKEVEKRLDILLNEIRTLSSEAYARYKGSAQQVLMETEYKGRASNNLWVQTARPFKPGQRVTVKITEVKGTLLIAGE